MQNDPTLPDDPGTEPFWEERYRQGVTPWDLGEASLAFQDLMSSPDAPSPGKLIVLGCGRGHDAVFFARQGFEVTAVDFSPSAIEEARKTAERAGAKVSFIEHDLFTLGSSHTHAYNYVVEHTCFAAIPVVMHEEYVEVVKKLLAPDGLYIAVFFTHGRAGGPPFTTSVDEITRLFESAFTIERLEPPARSAGERGGKEQFALMRRRATT